MISSLECIDFKEEYTDEFGSSRKVRNKSCQHFEINMKLYSNKGKFKKYTITFTCKFCKNDFVKEFYDNKKRIAYECIKCKNRIIFSYKNKLEDTVNPETEKKSDKGDIINNQVNPKFSLNKENNEAKLNIFKTPSFQPEPKTYKTPNNPPKNYSDSKLKIYQTSNQNMNDDNGAKLNIFKTPSFQPEPKIYKTPNNPPNSYSDPKLKLYQTSNQNMNDDMPAPTFQNIQNTINNNSDAIKKVKIKFVFNDSSDHIELDPSISMEQQYDIIQKKFNFQDKKKFI